MTAPDGDAFSVTYEVAYEYGVLTLAIIPPPGVAPVDRFVATDPRVEDNDLHFGWDPGIDLICVLESQDDGSFEGECLDPGGDSGHLTMVPPEEG